MTNKLEENVFNLVNEIGYKGPLVNRNEFSLAVQEGPKSVEFTGLVSYLANELRLLADFDECVSKMSTPEDSITFILELSSFLKEAGCPYACLTQGHPTDRYVRIEDKLLLLEYLITEVMAARILYESKPEKRLELKLNETPQAADMRKILQTLGFSRPPPNITIQALTQKLTQSVQNTIQKAGPELVGNSIFNGMLSEKQWEKLNDVYKELLEDYTIRREVLLKRLDCTIQSFQWSDKTKGKETLIDQIYTDKRKLLKVEPDVEIADLLAARDDLAIIEKTSSASVRKNTKSAINKVIIGQVPDRGGRTSEQAPPPPEMPPWQQRASGPPSGRGGYQGQSSNRGGSSNYSRGGGQQNFSPGGQRKFSQQQTQSNQGNYSHGGGAFDSAGSYGSGNNYNRGGSSYGGGNDYNRGGSDYNRGGSDYNRGGSDYNRGGSDHNRGGSDYNRSGSDYNRGGSDYNRSGGSNYNRGGSSYTTGASNFTTGGSTYTTGASSYTTGGSTYSTGGSSFGGGGSSFGGGRSDYTRGGSSYGGGTDYNRGGSSYGSGSNSSNVAFDSAGSYGVGNTGSYSKSFSQDSNYYQSGNDYSRGSSGRGSTGSYSDYNEPKRQKTFEQFQQNKTTYADQYVKESQHNQQYRPRSENTGGRGRSNYNRGGYR